MSNEIKTSVGLNVTNGNFKFTFSNQGSYNQTTLGGDSGIVTVSTTASTLTYADVSTEGMMLLQNLDSTNYVTYGPASGGTIVNFGRINPGEVHLLRLTPGITFKWQAHTAACQVYWVLLNS